MKRSISAILILALLFSIGLPLQAFAAVEGWYIVDSTSPNGYCYLYSNPTSQYGKTTNLGRYNNGALVYVLGQEGRYYRVSTQDGRSGYIGQSALRRYYGEVESAEDKAGWYVVSSTEPNGYCYLYSNPTSQYGQSTNLGRYDNGEMVYVLEYYGGGRSDNHYCRVQTQDGKTGYIRASSLFRYSASMPTAKPTVKPVNKLNQLPVLTYQCRGTVTGGSTNVYTGPAASYYRTSSGNASVGNGASLRVYGREGSYYLVEYSAVSGGKTVTRWSFVPVGRFSPVASVDNLSYDWLPITIQSGAHMADAPDWSHSYNTIAVDRDDAFALAKYVDSSGTTWVYFESIGYASTVSNQGYVSVRGFVPMSQVELR